MFDAIVAAAFENVQEADQVGARVIVRMRQRMSHARLCAEMDHALRTVIRKQLFHHGAIFEIGLDEAKILVSGELREPSLFKVTS